MVGFWIYKYEKNEDLTLIEYKSLDNDPDIIYPEVTICFIDPYFRNELINFTKETNFHQRYKEYIMGQEINETFEDLEYEKLTPNLFDHFQSLSIDWKPRKKYFEKICKDINTCPTFHL